MNADKVNKIIAGAVAAILALAKESTELVSGVRTFEFNGTKWRFANGEKWGERFNEEWNDWEGSVFHLPSDFLAVYPKAVETTPAPSSPAETKKEVAAPAPPKAEEWVMPKEVYGHTKRDGAVNFSAYRFKDNEFWPTVNLSVSGGINAMAGGAV